MVARAASALALASLGAAISAPPQQRAEGSLQLAGLEPDICSPRVKLWKTTESTGYYWSGKSGDAAGSGSSRNVVNRDIATGPSWSWKDEAETVVSSHPCIDGDKNVYLIHRDGHVRKFNSTGGLVWSYVDQGDKVMSRTFSGGCALMNGAVFVGNTDGKVRSLDMATGELRWLQQAGVSAGADSWSIAAHNDIVVVPGRSTPFSKGAAGNDQVIALDAQTGNKLWTYNIDGQTVDFAASIVDGPPSVVFADQLGVPHRLSLCDGRVLWRNPAHRSAAKPSSGGAVVEAITGRVLVSGNIRSLNNTQGKGSLTAYDLFSGKMIWEHFADLPANNLPSLGHLGGPGSPLSVLMAVGDAPGMPNALERKVGTYLDGRPLTYASKLYAVDLYTGAPTSWEFAPEMYKKPEAAGESPSRICHPDAWSSAAVARDGTVYVGHMSGNLFALRDSDQDGKLDSKDGEVSLYQGARCYQGSPAVAPGMLVATPCDGIHVFAE